MTQFDQFGQPIPSFTLKGQETTKTGLGACLSLMMTILVLSYAIVKFNHLVIHHNPNIATYPINAVYAEWTEPFNFTSTNLRPAFGFIKWDVWNEQS